MRDTTPSAGSVLAASAALQDPTRTTYTRAEVAYLLRLAYDSGRTATLLDDLAAMHAGWAAQNWRQTHKQRIADQLDEMDRVARAAAARAGRPYRIHPGGPVDWETGRPARTTLRSAA